MRIGFDAKRAFFNLSGLGNYSRNTIQYLQQYYPENEYLLYVPTKSGKFPLINFPGQQIIFPDGPVSGLFPSLWRSFLLPAKLKSDSIDLFHGLSNEIPFGIRKYNVRSVVTIHDLIFLRYPEWYNRADRIIYRSKTLYSCRNASRIIAVSRQTKSDIVEFYKISPEKIDVVYQGCNPLFYIESSQPQKEGILKKYGLTEGYLLYVGTVEKRKNLLNIVRAIYSKKISRPLVVIGRHTGYAQLVKKFIASHQMKEIIFLENVPDDDLAPLYQMASVFVYPSVYEGFGIPILEALYSKIPVITTAGGCFREAGGEHSVYIDPENYEQIADAIKNVLENNDLRLNMIIKGYDHALKFNDRAIAHNIFKVYQAVTEQDN
jgi:glycosyltransferase involved in cell wall biosynthesis